MRRMISLSLALSPPEAYAATVIMMTRPQNHHGVSETCWLHVFSDWADQVKKEPHHWLELRKCSKNCYPRPNLSAPSGTRTRVESMLRVHAQTWEASIIPLDQWRRGVPIGHQIRYIQLVKLCCHSLSFPPAVQKGFTVAYVSHTGSVVTVTHTYRWQIQSLLISSSKSVPTWMRKKSKLFAAVDDKIIDLEKRSRLGWWLLPLECWIMTWSMQSTRNALFHVLTWLLVMTRWCWQSSNISLQVSLNLLIPSQSSIGCSWHTWSPSVTIRPSSWNYLHLYFHWSYSLHVQLEVNGIPCDDFEVARSFKLPVFTQLNYSPNQDNCKNCNNLVYLIWY